MQRKEDYIEDIVSWSQGYDAAKAFCKEKKRKEELVTKSDRNPLEIPSYLNDNPKAREAWLLGYNQKVDSVIRKMEKNNTRNKSTEEIAVETATTKPIPIIKTTKKRKREDDDTISPSIKRPKGEHNKQDLTEEEADALIKNIWLNYNQHVKYQKFCNIFNRAQNLQLSRLDIAKEIYPHLEKESSLKRQIERHLSDCGLQFLTLRKQPTIKAVKKYFNTALVQPNANPNAGLIVEIISRKTAEELGIVTPVTPKAVVLPRIVIPPTELPKTIVHTVTSRTTIPPIIPVASVPLRTVTPSSTLIPPKIYTHSSQKTPFLFSQSANTSSSASINRNTNVTTFTEDSSSTEEEEKPSADNHSGHIKKRRWIPGYYK